jgi:hypothetical protein
MEIHIPPKRIAKILAAITVVLGFLSLLTGYYRMGIASLFNVSAELNIPTWFSSSLLFTGSVLLAIIAINEHKTHGRYVVHWTALSGVLLLLSVDEVSALHERMGGVVQGAFKSGLLNDLSWTVPAVMIVLCFVLAFAGFALNLPARTRRLFVLSAVFYLGGALVLEAVGGMWRAHGGGSRVYTLMSTMEECLGEMLGITIFIYALASYIDDNIGTISFKFFRKPHEPLSISILDVPEQIAREDEQKRAA